jgi:hypothetical protein
MIFFSTQNTVLLSLEFPPKIFPCDMMALVSSVSWSVIQIRELVQPKSYTVGTTFWQPKDSERDRVAKDR